jgi:hypothetical protein
VNYLVLVKNGPRFDDWKVCAIVFGLGKDDEQKAIEQGASEGEGEYWAVPIPEKEEGARFVTVPRFDLEPVPAEPLKPEPQAEEEAAVAVAEAEPKEDPPKG